MTEPEAIKNYSLLVEARLTKLEVNSNNVQDDIKEIKRNIKWIMGIVFSLNSTIIGLLAKGFHIV